MERKRFADLNLVISNAPIKCGCRQNCVSNMISVLFKKHGVGEPRKEMDQKCSWWLPWYRKFGMIFVLWKRVHLYTWERCFKIHTLRVTSVLNGILWEDNIYKTLFFYPFISEILISKTPCSEDKKKKNLFIPGTQLAPLGLCLRYIFS